MTRTEARIKAERLALDAAAATDKALQEWRSWAQFVYLGGGPVTLDDDMLRKGVCAAHDAQVQDALQNPLRCWCGERFSTVEALIDHVGKKGHLRL